MPEQADLHLNFYENLKEARMRLNYTVVMYDGEPYTVLCMANHMPDGIIRMYLDPLGHPDQVTSTYQSAKLPPYMIGDASANGIALGAAMDEWMKNNPKSALLRKQMNSPKFNRFRPFPLGNMFYHGDTVYVERTPTRKTEQGLTSYMLEGHRMRVGASYNNGRFNMDNSYMNSPQFRDTIMGKYHTPYEAWQLLWQNSGTQAVPFHRYFAFMKGPAGTTFLSYKRYNVGTVTKTPSGFYLTLTLDKQYKYLKELIEPLGLFNPIHINN